MTPGVCNCEVCPFTCCSDRKTEIRMAPRYYLDLKEEGTPNPEIVIQDGKYLGNIGSLGSWEIYDILTLKNGEISLTGIGPVYRDDENIANH